MRKKGRPNAEKRGGAREIVKSLQWLSLPLIYWGGTVPEIPVNEDDEYRPAPHLIGEKLGGSPCGIYAVQFIHERFHREAVKNEQNPEHFINPRVDCIRVSSALIARSSRAVQAARKYPRALPKVIPEAEKWLDRQSQSLNRRAAVLRAEKMLDESRPEAMAIEETCLWLGAEEDRPSQRLIHDDIMFWMGKEPDFNRPGQKAAAVLLGRRKTRISLPDELKVWYQAGAAFPNWPVDVVAGLTLEGEYTPSFSWSFKDLNHLHVAHILWEWMVFGQAVDRQFLNSLSALIRACDRLESEPDRRYQAFLHSMNQTIREIREYVDEDFIASEKNGEDAETRMNFFADIFIPHYRKFLKKQDLSIEWEKMPWLKILDFAYLYSLDGYFSISFFIYRRWATTLSSLENYVLNHEKEILHNTGWRAVILGLAVRAAVQAHTTNILLETTRWLDICRIHFIREEPEKGLSSQVIRSLNAGLMSSHGDRDNIVRLFHILAELGHQLLGNHLRFLLVHRTPLDFTLSQEMMRDLMAKLKVISRYGSLSQEQCRFIITRDLIDSTETVLRRNNPESLKEFIRWIEARGEGWFNIGLYHKRIWARLFRLSDQALVKGLLQGIEQSRESGNLAWPLKTEILDGLLQFCIRESQLEDNPYEPDDFPDEKKRQRFIRDHMWVMDEVVGAVLSVINNDRTEDAENEFSEVLRRRLPILSYIFHWWNQNYGNEGRLATALLEFCQRREVRIKEGEEEGSYRDILPENRDLQKLTVLISGGDIPHLLNILTYKLKNLENPLRLLLGWELSKNYPEMLTFIHSMSRKLVFLPGIFGLLNRLATVRLLPEKKELENFMLNWQNPITDDADSFPPSLMNSSHHMWRQFVGYSKLAGTKPAEKNILKILNLPLSMQNEYRNLLQKKRVGKLDDSSQKRLNKLTWYMNNPTEMDILAQEKLARLLSRQVPLLKMKTLDEGIKQVIRQHWKTMVKGKEIQADDPDWDNALWLYLSISKNRRVLRRLLSHEAREDRRWIWEHPENQKYLGLLKKSGGDADEWKKRVQKTWHIGGRVWQVYTENDPMKIFHMGNLFNTCLRVGGLHDYSVVANALEVNKRVLYLKNESGEILGRKLLLLRKDGILFGCHSYGSCVSYDFDCGGSPWVKILFDLFCLELAERCRLRLPRKDDSAAEEDFLLFSNWYFDGTEAIDGWVTELTDSSLSSGEKPASRQAELYRWIHQHLVDDRYLNEDVFRLFIWLGDDLLPIINKVMESSLVQKKDLLYISRFTQGLQVKKMIKEYCEHPDRL